MKTKKLTSILAAAVLGCTMLPLNAAADWGVTKAVLSEGAFYGIMIETDGTELTEDMVNTLEGFTYMQTWEEYTADYPWGYTETSVTPDGPCYMVYLGSMDTDTFTALGRQLSLELDFIENIYLVDYVIYGYATLLNGFTATKTDTAVVLDENSIPELEGFSVSDSGDTCDFFHRDFENSAFFSAMNEVASTTPEKYEYYLAYCEQIQSAHSDIIASIVPWLGFLESEEQDRSYTAASVWDGAGDSNTDGIVDAEDAASLLQTAAAAGTGAEITVTAAADVNADGTVSADDAAAVLRYAAAEGSGTPMSWAEVLR